MSDDLRAWLTQEINQRSWSHSELARQSGLSQAAVSNVLSGDRRAGADFCVKIAQALQEPPEKILRIAGILPTVPKKDSASLEIEEITRNLSPQQRQEALRYLRYLYQSDTPSD